MCSVEWTVHFTQATRFNCVGGKMIADGKVTTFSFLNEKITSHFEAYYGTSVARHKMEAFPATVSFRSPSSVSSESLSKEI